MTARWSAFGERVSRRLQAGDLPQIGLLVLAALVVVLGFAWPARPGIANESWYAVAQTRAVLVALLAVGYGMGLALEGPRQALATAVAVLIVAVSTLPLDLVAHAGSAPATPAWWSWVATVAMVVGQLAAGAAMGVIVRRLRLVALAPLLVPAWVAGLVALDLRFGVPLLNPLVAALDVVPGFVTVHAAAGAVALAVGAWAARRGWGAT